MSTAAAPPETTLEQWLLQIESLYAQIEEWAPKRGWATLRDERSYSERRLGEYRAPVLLVHAPQGRVLLEPISPFIVGAQGRIDVSQYPSFDSAAYLVRRDNSWRVRSTNVEATEIPWTEESFISAVKSTLALQ